MFSRAALHSTLSGQFYRRAFCAWPVVLAVVAHAALAGEGESVSNHSKRIIGATATMTETESGLSFPARIDTGAQSCSLHVEKVEIDDAAKSRLKNVGKMARIQLKDVDGKSKWIETEIKAAVRVKSSSLKSGEYDQRYKVRLTLKWKDFSKDVLVTLNDRTDMEFPLLIGRNFLRDDFLVDVSQKD